MLLSDNEKMPVLTLEEDMSITQSSLDSEIRTSRAPDSKENEVRPSQFRAVSESPTRQQQIEGVKPAGEGMKYFAKSFNLSWNN